MACGCGCGGRCGCQPRRVVEGCGCAQCRAASAPPEDASCAVGAAVGAGVGFAVGGPVGALIGGILGSLFGCNGPDTTV